MVLMPLKSLKYWIRRKLKKNWMQKSNITLHFIEVTNGNTDITLQMVDIVVSRPMKRANLSGMLSVGKKIICTENVEKTIHVIVVRHWFVRIAESLLRYSVVI